MRVILMHRHACFVDSPPASISSLDFFTHPSRWFRAGLLTLRTPSSGSFMQLSSSALPVDLSLFGSTALSDCALLQSSQENESRKLIYRLLEYEMNLCALCFLFFCFLFFQMSVREGPGSEREEILSSNGGHLSHPCTQLCYLLRID